MELTVAKAGADFNTGNHFNPQLSPGCYSFGNTGHNVVIRDGQRGDTCHVGES
jgi:hypothetical protein